MLKKPSKKTRERVCEALRESGFQGMAEAIEEMVASKDGLTWDDLSDLHKDVEWNWEHVGEDEDRPLFDKAHELISELSKKDDE